MKSRGTEGLSHKCKISNDKRNAAPRAGVTHEGQRRLGATPGLERTSERGRVGAPEGMGRRPAGKLVVAGHLVSSLRDRRTICRSGRPMPTLAVGKHRQRVDRDAHEDKGAQQCRKPHGLCRLPPFALGLSSRPNGHREHDRISMCWCQPRCAAVSGRSEHQPMESRWKAVPGYRSSIKSIARGTALGHERTERCRAGRCRSPPALVPVVLKSLEPPTL